MESRIYPENITDGPETGWGDEDQEQTLILESNVSENNTTEDLWTINIPTKSVVDFENAINEDETELDLGYKDLSAQDIIKFVTPIEQFRYKFLTKIYLNGNRIGDEGLIAIATLNVSKLYVNDNFTSDNGIAAIAATNIETFHASGCYLTEEGIAALANNKTLTELDISYTRYRQHNYGPLARHPSLTYLDISGNNVYDEFGYSISNNKIIKTLIMNDLWGQNFGFLGLQAIKLNTSLKTISLRNNNFTDPEIAEIAYHSTVTDLDVSHNYLTARGAYHLSYTPCLEKLNLKNNNIGNEGAYYLSFAPSLRELNLCNNGIGNFGAKYLHALSLFSLNLNKNNLSYYAYGYLQRHPTLQNLKINNNSFATETYCTGFKAPPERLPSLIKLSLFSLDITLYVANQNQKRHIMKDLGEAPELINQYYQTKSRF